MNPNGAWSFEAEVRDSLSEAQWRRIPGDAAACIHSGTGLRKVMVDARFSKIDNDTYQSADFDRASRKVEITANSGAGNVIISSK